MKDIWRISFKSDFKIPKSISSRSITASSFYLSSISKNSGRSIESYSDEERLWKIKDTSNYAYNCKGIQVNEDDFPSTPAPFSRDFSLNQDFFNC